MKERFKVFKNKGINPCGRSIFNDDDPTRSCIGLFDKVKSDYLYTLDTKLQETLVYSRSPPSCPWSAI